MPPVTDASGARGAYRELAEVLRGRIRSGVYPPGARLPGEAQLAREHGVSRDRVRLALAVLRADGLVTTRQGGGTRVRPAPNRRVVTLNHGDRAIARMPTEAERHRLRLPEGVPVFEISRASGGREIHPADRVALARATP